MLFIKKGIYPLFSYALSLCLSFVSICTLCLFSECQMQSRALCSLQNICLFATNGILLINIHFGPKAIYLSMAAFCSVTGLFSAVWLACDHICISSPPFGDPFWGWSYYSWTMIVFSMSLASIAILLMLHKEKLKVVRRGDKDLMLTVCYTLWIVAFFIFVGVKG